jgi:hypothetical protein
MPFWYLWTVVRIICKQPPPFQKILQVICVVNQKGNAKKTPSAHQVHIPPLTWDGVHPHNICAPLPCEGGVCT